jgi:hypothetical protein
MKLLFTAIVICFCSLACAQNYSGTLDSIKKKLDTLSYRTDEKNYIRVPRNDLKKEKKKKKIHRKIKKKKKKTRYIF